MDTTAVPLRPLGTGELLDAAFGLYRQLFAPLVAIQVVCGLPAFALSIFAESAGSRSPGLLLLGYVFAFTLGAIGTAATALLIGERYLGHVMQAGDALRGILGRAGAVLGTALLTGLAISVSALPAILMFASAAVFGMRGETAAVATMLTLGLGGLVLLAVPLFVFTGTSLSTIALVLEPSLQGTAALARSWGLTKGVRLRLMAVFFVLLLILFVAVTGLGAVAGTFLGGDTTAGRLAVTVGSSLVTFAFQPALYCVLTLTYYDRRVRLEGFDLEVLAESLAAR